jgi:putative spermidine/putrescine transport system permease protein
MIGSFQRVADAAIEMASRILGGLFVVAVFAFLLGPFFVIFVTSFSASQAMAFPPPGFSLQWYARFIDHILEVGDARQGFVDSILLSVTVGLGASALTVGTGVLAAYVFARSRWRARDVVRQLFALPIVFPQIVIGIGLLVFFSELKFGTPTTRLVLGHAIICLPYVIMIVAANLELYDPSVEEAALGLGAGPMRTFFRITLPIVRPGIIAATVFAFIISFTNFTVSFFLISEGLRTLPVWIFNVIEHFLDPMLAVVSVMLIVMTAITAFIVDRLVGLAGTRRQRKETG